MTSAERRLEEAMERAREATIENARRCSEDMATAYTITIPAQCLTVISTEMAKHTLRVLKGFGVRGTYRKTKEGGAPAQDREEAS